MSKTEFSLQAVQQLREAERDQCRQQLAATRELQTRAEGTIVELRTRLAELRTAVRMALAPGTLEIGVLVDRAKQEQRLRELLRSEEQRRGELADRSQLQREALAASDREVRLLQRMSERQHQRRLNEQQRRESREIDDLASCAARQGLWSG